MKPLKKITIFVFVGLLCITLGIINLQLIGTSQELVPLKELNNVLPNSKSHKNLVTLELVGSYPLEDDLDEAYGIHVQGNYVYLAVLGLGLLIIDISDPTNPTQTGLFNDSFTSSGTREVFVSGSYAYVATGSYFQAINISNPASPDIVDESYYKAEFVFISGSYAYVGGSTNGLIIADISDPTNLTVTGQLAYDNALSFGVFVSGSYAYVADGNNRLMIINISDPANPTETGNISFDARPYNVFVSGSYAYVAGGTKGLRIIDISDPANPTETGQFVEPIYSIATDVVVSGSYAFFADGSDGLEVIDISDPANPTEAGDFDDGGDARDVFLSGSYVYVADGSDGLEILSWEETTITSTPTTSPTTSPTSTTSPTTSNGGSPVDNPGFELIGILLAFVTLLVVSVVYRRRRNK
ncbi:MAG: LVIVD repeat-containing protein [Promethearchaeota archaeon]